MLGRKNVLLLSLVGSAVSYAMAAMAWQVCHPGYAVITARLPVILLVPNAALKSGRVQPSKVDPYSPQKWTSAALWRAGRHPRSNRGEYL